MIAFKRLLTAMFAALWLLDTASTLAFVHLYGLEAEANPVMRACMAAIGMGGFAAVKAGVLAAWLLLAHRAHIAVHFGLVAIMSPVVFMGVQVAWS